MELTAFAGWLNSAFAVYDSTILKLMHSLAESLGSILTPIMKVITLLGEKGLILILLSIALMLFTRTRRVGVCMFGAIACGAILTNFVLKDLVARPRPFDSLTVYRQWWEFLGAPAEDGFSFPSGHVTAATAGMTALCLTRGRKWVIPSVLWVLLMAVSRNYLMAHFPSDVLFAVVIGLIGLIAVNFTLPYLAQIFASSREQFDQAFCDMIVSIHRWEMLGYITLGVNSACNALMLGYGYAKRTMLLNMARVFVFRIPVLWYLQNYTLMGAEAVGVTMMVSNIATGICSALVVIPVIREIRRMSEKYEAGEPDRLPHLWRRTGQHLRAYRPAAVPELLHCSPGL